MLWPIVGRLRRSVNAIEGGILRMLNVCLVNVECLFVIASQVFKNQVQYHLGIRSSNIRMQKSKVACSIALANRLRSCALPFVSGDLLYIAKVLSVAS